MYINLKGYMVGNGVTNWHHDTLASMMDVAYYRSVLDLETYDQIVENKCNSMTYWSNWSDECKRLFF